MTTPDLPSSTKRSWHRFLETYEPLRSDLYRYCRYLTRNPWDAEDLAQDALARAFVTLARMEREPTNPRAWLFRVASNLWIDQLRRHREAADSVPDPAVAMPTDSLALREAAGTLLVKLSPQERAAVVLKDVFDFSLEETAATLGTTVGGIKAALHRGRRKLIDEGVPKTATVPLPRALDEFCTAFNTGDLDRLTALLLDSAAVEVVGAVTEYGPEAARNTILTGLMFGSRLLADPAAPIGVAASFREGVLADPPCCEARLHRGRWLLLHWYQHLDGEAVRGITVLELDGDRIARLVNYFFSSDFLVDVCGELGVPVRVNGHRWWLPEPE